MPIPVDRSDSAAAVNYDLLVPLLAGIAADADPNENLPDSVPTQALRDILAGTALFPFTATDGDFDALTRVGFHVVPAALAQSNGPGGVSLGAVHNIPVGTYLIQRGFTLASPAATWERTRPGGAGTAFGAWARIHLTHAQTLALLNAGAALGAGALAEDAVEPDKLSHPPTAGQILGSDESGNPEWQDAPAGSGSSAGTATAPAPLANGDFNALVARGFWFVPDTLAQSNGPTVASAAVDIGSVRVYRSAGDIVQRATEDGGARRMFVRSTADDGATWSAWRLYLDGVASIAAALNAEGALAPSALAFSVGETVVDYPPSAVVASADFKTYALTTPDHHDDVTEYHDGMLVGLRLAGDIASHGIVLNIDGAGERPLLDSLGVAMNRNFVLANVFVLAQYSGTHAAGSFVALNVDGVRSLHGSQLVDGAIGPPKQGKRLAAATNPSPARYADRDSAANQVLGPDDWGAHSEVDPDNQRWKAVAPAVWRHRLSAELTFPTGTGTVTVTIPPLMQALDDSLLASVRVRGVFADGTVGNNDVTLQVRTGGTADSPENGTSRTFTLDGTAALDGRLAAVIPTSAAQIHIDVTIPAGQTGDSFTRESIDLRIMERLPEGSVGARELA